MKFHTSDFISMHVVQLFDLMTSLKVFRFCYMAQIVKIAQGNRFLNKIECEFPTVAPAAFPQ